MKVAITVLFNLFFLSSFAQDNVPASIYDFKVAAQNGGTIDFAQFRGKKILIVNTPSEADNNPYYSELESLYAKYKDKLVIVAFLDNDFLVAPGSKKSTQPRGEKHYNVSFPMASKVLVRTDQMAPIYKWLTNQKYNKLSDNEVAWDFQKYLINEQGSLVAVIEPRVRPQSPELTNLLDK
jgi:glutathione peroxidase